MSCLAEITVALHVAKLLGDLPGAEVNILRDLLEGPQPLLHILPVLRLRQPSLRLPPPFAILRVPSRVCRVVLHRRVLFQLFLLLQVVLRYERLFFHWRGGAATVAAAVAAAAGGRRFVRLRGPAGGGGGLRFTGRCFADAFSAIRLLLCTVLSTRRNSLVGFRLRLTNGHIAELGTRIVNLGQIPS
jgi:hypothetical protein